MNIKDLKNLFIPSAENKYRPDFLERASVGVMLVLILLSFAIANIQALVWIGSDWMVSTILPAVIVDLTNEERSNGKLTTLKRNDVLDAAAKLKAEDMAKNEYFAHYSPSGVSPWYWFDQVSYNYVYAGENLAVHFTDSSDVVDAWMKSPTHRENIMNGTYAEIGVGTAKGIYKGAPTIFVVQLFGTQSSVAKVEEQAPPVIVLAPESIKASTPSDLATNVNSNTNVLSENISKEENDVVVEEVEVPVELSDSYEAPAREEQRMLANATPNTDTVLYSDLATTSREGVPAIMSPVDENPSSNTGVSKAHGLDRTVTQPGLWLQIVYGALALLVVFALILSIVIEWRKQHPIQMIYAGGLLAVMALLFHVHTLLTQGVLIA